MLGAREFLEMSASHLTTQKKRRFEGLEINETSAGEKKDDSSSRMVIIDVNNGARSSCSSFSHSVLRNETKKRKGGVALPAGLTAAMLERLFIFALCASRVKKANTKEHYREENSLSLARSPARPR